MVDDGGTGASDVCAIPGIDWSPGFVRSRTCAKEMWVREREHGELEYFVTELGREDVVID